MQCGAEGIDKFCQLGSLLRPEQVFVRGEVSGGTAHGLVIPCLRRNIAIGARRKLRFRILRPGGQIAEQLRTFCARERLSGRKNPSAARM